MAELPVSARGAPPDLLVRAELIRTVFRLSVAAVAANVVNCALLTVLFWDVAPRWVLIAFAIMVAGGSALHMTVKRRFDRLELSPQEVVEWGKWAVIGSLSAGACWAFLVSGAFPSESLPHQVFLVFLVAGLCGGVAGTFAARLAAVWACIVPLCGALSLRLLLEGEDTHLVMAVMVALFACIMLWVATLVHRSMRRAFELGFENEGLVADLSQARDQLEERVAGRTAELAASERRFAELVDESPDGVVSVTGDDVIEAVNPAMERLCGYTAQQLVGRNLATLGAQAGALGERLQALLEEAACGESRPAVELELTHREGRRVAVEVVPRLVVRDDDSRRIQLVVRDATERRRLEDERAALKRRLQTSKRTEAVGRLAAGVAHELNNLLTVVQGNVETLLSEADAASSERRALEDVRDTTGRAAELGQRLLAVGGGLVLKRRRLDINELLLSWEQRLRAVLGRRIELHLLPCSGPASVLADPHALASVLEELASAAREEMDGQGRLTVETAVTPMAPPELLLANAVKPGACVLIRVSNTGVGMDAETREHIFEPRFSTRGGPAWRNLGLATAHGLVRQSGGGIAVDSEPGAGTTFRIYLPHAPGGRSRRAGRPESKQDEPDRRTILLVDDDVTLLRVIQRALIRSGYQVWAASSAEEALQLLNERTEPIDALVVDVVMPVMDGPTLANKALELKPELRVLLTSGYSGDKVGPEHPFEVFPKPFTPRALAAKVEAILDA